MQNIFMEIGNALTTLILRSPLHEAISKNNLLLAINGHKSGNEIMLPVNYFQYGETLYITSPRGRKWWRNLRGSAPVVVHQEGRDLNGMGIVVEGGAATLENFKSLFQTLPKAARYLGVRLDSTDQPNTQDIAQLAQERVLVKVCLNQKN